MQFNSPQSVEQTVWQMRLADYPRAVNRARVNSLFNGGPPYSAQEQRDNNIATNVNDLSATELDMQARRQFQNAFCVPDPLFEVSLDFGPVHKRAEWGAAITKRINKVLIDSPQFLDLRDGIFAQTILHAAGPSGWANRMSWKPVEYGMEDILVPSNTLRSLDNLPFFAIYRSYSVNQLWKLAKGPVVDPGWNMDVVNQVLKWVDSQTQTLLGQTWPEVWSPEKMDERFKQDGGLYASDAVPTVDCYDFYFWDDDDKHSGWKRRIILDAWGQPGTGALTATQYATRGNKTSITDHRYKHLDFAKGKFLYNSKNRIYADKLEKIIHFQFGDVSSVAPFRYHSMRGLGFLLYAVCHLQNRLKCRFNDAVFESLMQYFRAENPADAERVQKVDLVNNGWIPPGLQFVKSEERWKYDTALAQAAMEMNDKSMQDKAGPYIQDYKPTRSDETATLTMARINSSNSLISAVLHMGYMREKFRYQEICRRYCIKDSKDGAVKKVRLQLLRDDRVPAAALDVDRWDIKMNRALGGGNRMMEVAIAEKLMAVRDKHGPEAQHRINIIYDAAVTGDYALARDLNPDMPLISNTVHDTQQTFGALMAGADVQPVAGLNPIEVIVTMLAAIEKEVGGIMQSGGVGTPQQVKGLSLAAQYTASFLQQLGQDKQQKGFVKINNDRLGKAMNEVKAMAQRQQEQAQQAAAAGPRMKPDDAAKIQAIMMTAQTKAELAKQSHAQKTAQRQLQFEQKMKQDADKHFSELVMNGQKQRVNLFEE